MPSAKIKNTTNFTRDGIVTIGIPFPKSFNLQPGDTLVVDGAVAGNNNQLIQWYPQGIRWDNGAVKYARASFRVENLLAQEERVVQISRSTNSTPIPFVINPTVAQSLPFININNGSTAFNFRIYQIPAGQGAGSNGRDTFINIQNSTLIEGGGPNDHYARYRYFTYLPTNPNLNWVDNIWVEVVTEVFSNLPYCQFFFRWGFHKWRPGINPNSPSAVDPNLNGYPYTPRPHLNGLTQPITFNISGPRSVIRWAGQKMKLIGTPSPFYGGVISTQNNIYSANWSWPSLYIGPGGDSGRFVVGTSHAYKGSLLYEVNSTTNAEAEEQILAIAEDWENIYPVTGIMPSDPPYILNKADLFDRSNRLLAALSSLNLNSIHSGAYNWPTINNNPESGQGGNHGIGGYAFGKRGYPFLKCSNYNWIPFLEWATRQDACRVGWFIDSEGYPLRHSTIAAAGAFLWGGTFFRDNPSGGYGSPIYNAEGVIVGWTGEAPEGPLVKGSTPSLVLRGLARSHYQLDMHVMQAFITMDYFSLVWAATRAKNMLYTYYPTSFIGSGYTAFVGVGNARELGRPFSNLSFLLEFLGEDDSPLGDRGLEIIPWVTSQINRILTDPVYRGFGNTTGTRLLDKNLFPGGLEVVRPLVIVEPANGGSNLGAPPSPPAQVHWMPWQESMVVNGLFLMHKAISTRYPTNTLGLKLLDLSRDIAASIVNHAFQDYRPTTGKQAFQVLCNSAEIKTTVYSILPTIIPSPGANAITITGQTSGATGTIYYWGNGIEAQQTIEFNIKNTTGTFILGEPVRLNIGNSSLPANTPFGNISKLFKVKGSKSITLTPPSSSFGRVPNDQEKEILIRDAVFLHSNYPLDLHPAGHFHYVWTYPPYEYVQLPALAVAKQAAEQGYYGSSQVNTTLLSKIYSLLQYFVQETPYYIGGRGGPLVGDGAPFSNTIEETFISEAGYLTSDILNAPALPSIPVVVNVPSETVRCTTPSVTTAITNFSTAANVTASTISSSLSLSPVQNVITTTVSNAIVSVGAISTGYSISLIDNLSLGNSFSVGTISSEASVSSIEAILILSVLPGRKVMTFISYEPLFRPSLADDATDSSIPFVGSDQEF